MALFSSSLQVIRHYLSASVGDLLYGQCGTTGALTNKTYAPFLWKANDYYNDNNYEVYVYAGTNVGVTKRVTDWVLADLLLTVHSVYDAACDATSYIELHRIFTEDEYRKAINLAIQSLKNKYLIDVIDETTTLVADTFEYTLPTTLHFVHRITTENAVDGGLFYDTGVIDTRNWELISPRKLKLNKSYYSVSAGKDLRIEGQGVQATVDGDADIIYLPLDWIRAKAITMLPQNKVQSNKLDETYRGALITSAREPLNSSHPDSKKVVE